MKLEIQKMATILSYIASSTIFIRYNVPLYSIEVHTVYEYIHFWQKITKVNHNISHLGHCKRPSKRGKKFKMVANKFLKKIKLQYQYLPIFVESSTYSKFVNTPQL